ncbi:MULTISPECIES: DUF6084 family protein [Nocardia]|uniref:DUF6084 family protein n=1 Tax=Nocardia TaxID=1817 RepID=UPI0007E9D028|nr:MULTISPECIES: DUF6084 family protein [Nocardia]MBF6273944.1 hypothetical protein [Nocardia nova]OBA43406.1 hypothetical protein A5789_10770 [Nocardia sp. 852002-51101_SCH5132738]OBB34005.1 hypothetical protein A5748_07280 [Nocardia sp. 852002-51244_SCH5132740]OBF71295.1 hypothetical protein A9X06_30270 [Mycobacterium sp. 852002-51759_SCH5129042]
MSPAYATTFAVLGLKPEPYAVTPILSARIGIASVGAEPVHAIALRAQVRIEPNRRNYTDAESAGLLDLFGPRDRWDHTQRSFLWMHCATTVPGFTGGAEVDLPMPCTYDLEVAGSKYLHALRGGEVPLLFLFSGTVFIRGSNGFAVQQIPWDRDDRYRMPVSVWRELMAAHFPATGWLRLHEDTLAALAAYKGEHGLLGFDETVARLLASAQESA